MERIYRKGVITAECVICRKPTRHHECDIIRDGGSGYTANPRPICPECRLIEKDGEEWEARQAEQIETERENRAAWEAHESEEREARASRYGLRRVPEWELPF